MTKIYKPTIVLDFDGVIHSYDSGWKGAENVTDLPVPGALSYISLILGEFEVAIFSSRSCQPGGLKAMQEWLLHHMKLEFGPIRAKLIYDQIKWPLEKPPAKVTIDDRAICFTGEWPPIHILKTFEPWNKKKVNIPSSS